MKLIVPILFALTLAGCEKPGNARLALEEVRSAARDVVLKTEGAEKALATDVDKEALRTARATLKKAEKLAREQGASELDLMERRRIGETEGKKIALELVR
jgi:hypothetical protein